MEDLKYPIGKFQPKDFYTPTELAGFITTIEELPTQLERAVASLTESQLDTPYREGGWTVRQVVHHVADSHTNAYIRFKWALTEDTPVIKAYDEKGWATTPETKASPVASLALLKALHQKWVILLRGMDASDFQKSIIHPETTKHIRLENLCGSYAWHGEHHLAHITSLKKRMGWK